MRVSLNEQEIKEAISAGFSAKGVHIVDGSIEFKYDEDGYDLLSVSAEVQSVYN